MGKPGNLRLAASRNHLSNMQASRERIEMIRRWHIEQAIAEDYSEAMVFLSITASNEVRACSIGVEPEHALVMLPTVEEVAQIMRGHAITPRPGSGATVQSIRRA